MITFFPIKKFDFSNIGSPKINLTITYSIIEEIKFHPDSEIKIHFDLGGGPFITPMNVMRAAKKFSIKKFNTDSDACYFDFYEISKYLEKIGHEKIVVEILYDYGLNVPIFIVENGETYIVDPNHVEETYPITKIILSDNWCDPENVDMTETFTGFVRKWNRGEGEDPFELKQIFSIYDNGKIRPFEHKKIKFVEATEDLKDEFEI